MSQSGSQVVSSLRKMVISGEFAPGERIAEIPVAKRLGVSRTPVRLAFRALEQEGLLAKAGARGYAVRAFTADEIRNAIEVRGVLEGLAARLVAERGISPAARAALLDCLAMGDAIFRGNAMHQADVETYHAMNMRFHRIIIEESRNHAIAEAVTRNDHLPFGSANSIAYDNAAPVREFARLHFAHAQHHIVVDAIDRGQSARAEAMMREHANAGLHYVEVFSRYPNGTDNLQIIKSGA